LNATRIEYADFTWNPIVGCTRGCPYCYARRLAKRQKHRCPTCYAFTPHLHPQRLAEPLSRKKPARIFVCDMGDLFDPHVRLQWQEEVWEVMSVCNWHTFLVLTKRPHRMREFIAAHPYRETHPLPNVMVGVSVTDEAEANERIPPLLATPAAYHWVSLEPLMGPMDLTDYLEWGWKGPPWVEWVVIGALTGGWTVQCDIEWVRWIRSLHDQCRRVNTPLFIKSLRVDGRVSRNLAEWPEDLRIREYPRENGERDV